MAGQLKKNTFFDATLSQQSFEIFYIYNVKISFKTVFATIIILKEIDCDFLSSDLDLWVGSGQPLPESESGFM